MDAIKNNKNAKIGLAVLAGVLIVGLLFWTLVIPASAEKVCNHGYDLLEKYAEDEDLDIKDYADDKDEFIKDCVEDEEKRTEDKDRSKVKAYRSCLLDKDKLEDMSDCEKELK